MMAGLSLGGLMAEDPNPGVDSAADTAVAPLPSHAPVDTVRFTPGTLLAGRYRIIAPLGKGGMGEVYRADDIRLGQPVALKFLPAALASDSQRLERLVDEVRIGRQISHPNVCRLYDIAEAEGLHFLVMEYVDGEDLASLLRRIGRLPGDKALEIARGLCAGLAAAHDKAVIHRDLKPANVMIDGRGHARIADFGLAALAGDGSVTGLAGTPSYMAPEQLTGEGASTRSDVFALGLILHEMLSGKRVFDAKSLEEILALHAQSKPLGLSSSVKDVDPEMERLVLRCLARDPKARPASARVVLMSLPGGDALQAAVLAGETPSPEMVAAAAKVGDLTAPVAWACLAVGLVALLSIAMMAGRVLLLRRVPLSKSPDVLVARAKEVLARLGYSGEPADSAGAFMISRGFLNHVERTDRSPDRWERAGGSRPGLFRFYYRASPQEMYSSAWISVFPWFGPPELGRVTHDEPPLNVPGMTDVVLDMQGRLVSFVAVPPAEDDTSRPAPEPDWSPLLTEAGLDSATLSAAPPRWTAPVDSDRKVAWSETRSKDSDTAIRIEAAAFRGRPVYFEIRGAWAEGGEKKPPPASATRSTALNSATIAISMAAIPLVLVVVALVRRNIRRGRGDRRGAFRLALATFASLTLAHFLRADHTSVATGEYALVVAILSQACYGAVWVWAIYMAMEPAVRRRLPHTLISWTRMLDGRFKDPLVARDVLVGLLLGFATTLNAQISVEVPTWFGRASSLGTVSVTALSSPWHLAYYALLGPFLGMLYALSLLLLLYLFQALVGRTWLSRALLAVFAAMPVIAQANDPLFDVVSAIIFATLVVLALTRFGLLTSAVLLFTFLLLVRSPLTLNSSAWYSGRSFAVLGFFALFLGFAFYHSLGGKPLFGKALLDE